MAFVPVRLDPSRLRDLAREIVRVLVVIRALNPDMGEDELFALVADRPLGNLGNQTALALIETGRTDDVVGYFESLHSGFAG